MDSFDVVIVGGGMVGLTAALALKDSDLKVAVIEPDNPAQEFSDKPALRVSALNLASRQVFDNLGIWQHIEQSHCQPYQSMDVWEQDSFASIQFSHQQVGQPQLGYIVENQRVVAALWQALHTQSNVTCFTGAKIQKLHSGQRESFITLDNDTVLTARLVVGADGANSYVRQQAALPLTFWDYEQTSIVATVKTELAHESCARQVFTPTGPLAFLPLYKADLCSIVWSQQHDEAARLMQLDDTEFNKALSAAFDLRLGRSEVVSERRHFKLKMRYARQWVAPRIALIGDAAHTIHPLAGQGANLGLMDACALAETLIDIHSAEKDIGDVRQLRAFERWRKTEAMKMVMAMEGFKRLFEGRFPAKKLFRDLGLTLFNNVPMAKQKIIEQAMGISGELPELARSTDSGRQY